MSIASAGQHAHHWHSCCTPPLWVHSVNVVGAARRLSMSTAVHHLFGPAMSVSTAPEGRHAYGCHPSPCTTSPGQLPSFLRHCRQTYSRQHLRQQPQGSRVVELSPVPGTTPPPGVSPLLVYLRTPSPSISVAVTGSPKLTSTRGTRLRCGCQWLRS